MEPEGRPTPHSCSTIQFLTIIAQVLLLSCMLATLSRTLSCGTYSGISPSINNLRFLSWSSTGLPLLGCEDLVEVVEQSSFFFSGTKKKQAYRFLAVRVQVVVENQRLVDVLLRRLT